jgi:hypothetical protein
MMAASPRVRRAPADSDVFTECQFAALIHRPPEIMGSKIGLWPGEWVWLRQPPATLIPCLR